jgi:hypothetical protein
MIRELNKSTDQGNNLLCSKLWWCRLLLLLLGIMCQVWYHGICRFFFFFFFSVFSFCERIEKGRRGRGRRRKNRVKWESERKASICDKTREIKERWAGLPATSGFCLVSRKEGRNKARETWNMMTWKKKCPCQKVQISRLMLWPSGCLVARIQFVF